MDDRGSRTPTLAVAGLSLAPALLACCALGCSPVPEDVECRADLDCGAEHLCLAGQCRDLHSPCAADEQCLPGQLCVEGSCQNACSADDQCPAGSFCDQGRCRDGCATDGDCPIGTLCDAASHACLPGCSADGQCPQGQHCRDGQCAADECVSDADCLAPRRCLAGLCTQAGCASDADCEAGQRCVEAVCQAAGCAADSDCPAGEVCLAGACAPAGSCEADIDCPPGESCQDGRCQAAGCSADADCEAGQRCLAGGCTAAECLTDADCPAGQACAQGACTAEAACDYLAQDCEPGQKCSPDAAGQPACQPAGDGSGCAAQQADDCPAGELCTGYVGYACHTLCTLPAGAGCPAGTACAALDAVAGLGTCQCEPLAQACGASLRCAYDPSNTPVCQPAGDGSQCYASGLDDCPAGMLCATADDAVYDCFDLCQAASGAGCQAYYTCYGVDGLADVGLCVPDCHPVRQDCPAGQKCTLDEYSAPICWGDVGSGSGCAAGTVDDCPVGQVCADGGGGFACHPFCIVYNGIGCGSDERCAGLDASPHWGACLPAARGPARNLRRP